MTSATMERRRQGARINDIDVSIERAAITDVDDNGALIYADGITIHLAPGVILELAQAFDAWNREVPA